MKSLGELRVPQLIQLKNQIACQISERKGEAVVKSLHKWVEEIDNDEIRNVIKGVNTVYKHYEGLVICLTYNSDRYRFEIVYFENGSMRMVLHKEKIIRNIFSTIQNETKRFQRVIDPWYGEKFDPTETDEAVLNCLVKYLVQNSSKADEIYRYLLSNYAESASWIAE